MSYRGFFFKGLGAKGKGQRAQGKGLRAKGIGHREYREADYLLRISGFRYCGKRHAFCLAVWKSDSLEVSALLATSTGYSYAEKATAHAVSDRISRPLVISISRNLELSQSLNLETSNSRPYGFENAGFVISVESVNIIKNSMISSISCSVMRGFGVKFPSRCLNNMGSRLVENTNPVL